MDNSARQASRNISPKGGNKVISRIKHIFKFFTKTRRRKILSLILALLILLTSIRLGFFPSKKAKAASIQLTTTSTTIQVDVPNRYRAIMQKGDTSDYLLIYDRAQNDSSPSNTYEFIGPYIYETAAEYMLRYHNTRKTTILESSNLRVRIRVEGCFDTAASGACLTDGTTALTVTEDYTFTTEGMYVSNITDFKTSGVALDIPGANENGYNFLMIDGDIQDNAFSGTLYYGDGATEGNTAIDATFEETNTYATFPAVDASGYQSAIIGIQRAGWFDQSGGTEDWRIDIGYSGTIDRLHAREGNVTPIGIHSTKWYFLLQPENDLDTEAERESFFNDLTNPDILEFTTGSEWNDAPASPGVEFDGSHDYINVADANSLDLTNTGSIEAWVKPDTVASSESSFGSFSALTAPDGANASDANDGVDITIVGNKIYYAAYLHDDATESFSTSNSNLDGSSQASWTNQTDPDGAGIGDSTSVAVDSDGDKLYYAVLATDGVTESFYTANSNLDGTSLSSWTSQTAPDGCGDADGCSIDMVIVGSKMYFAAYLHSDGTEAFRTANSNLDGTSFSGWTTQTNPGGVPANLTTTSVGIESDGQKLYYATYTNDATSPYAPYFFTAYSDLDGTNFSAWVNQSDPDGGKDYSFIDMVIIGNKLYFAAYMHDASIDDFLTAEADLDGANMTSWTSRGDPGGGIGGGESASPGVATDGKNIYYTAFSHNNEAESLSLASSIVTSHPVISKTDAYELIQTGGGFVFDWAGSPKSFGNIPANQWSHVAITLDGTTLRYYINGSEVRNQPTTTDFSSNANALRMGGNSTYYDGVLDEVRIFDDARTAAEVSQNMFKQVSRSEGGLVSAWRMNENTGTVSHDENDTNNNDGTLTTGPVWSTGFVADHYNEAERTYTIDASGDQVQIDIDAGNDASTLVNDVALNAGDTSFTVDSTTGFPDGGGSTTYYAYIEGDKFSYTDTTATTFTGIPSSGELSVVGHADNSVVSLINRHKPMWKIGKYRKNTKPTSVAMEGSALTEGVDYNLDYKPIAAAFFADQLTWASTLESTTTDVGGNVTQSGCNFVGGKYGKGAECNADSADLSVTVATGTDYNKAKSAVEFWYQPYYNHTDSALHDIFALYYDTDNRINLYKHSTNALELRYEQANTAITYSITSANYSWQAYDWVHIRAEWDDSEALATQQRIYINGVEPATHSDSGTDMDSTVLLSPTTLYIGNSGAGGTSEANGIIDEFRIYNTDTDPDTLAGGGNTADPSEYLFDETSDYTLDFVADDANNRGEYIFIGSDSMFSGINIDLATNGVAGTTPDLNWQYWDGDSWADLESISGFTDGTTNLTSDGAIYWSVNPTNWRPYSVNGSTDLYYIRAHLESGSYTTNPSENLIRTDTLIFQYLRFGGNISSENQTLEIPGYATGSRSVTYWKFDEGYGSTVSDSVGSNNSGTITNAVWKEEGLCWEGKCLYFDGTGDYVSRSDDSDFDFNQNNSFSIEAWVRHPSSISAQNTIAAKFESTGSDGGYKLYLNASGYACFGIDDENSSFPEDSACGTTSLADSKWHHLVGVKNGSSSISLYVDGRLITSDASIQAANSLENNDTFYVGIDGDGSSNAFTGFIDEFKLYRYVRNADEIRSDYIQNAESRGSRASLGIRNYSYLSDGLVGYWKMDESATPSTDSSGNGINGTWNGNTSQAIGKFGSATSFDGTDDYVNMGDQTLYDFSDGQDFTVSAWFYLDSYTSDRAIISNKSSQGVNVGWLLTFDDPIDRLAFAVADGTDEFDVYTGAITTNQWLHVIAVFDDDDTTYTTIYINGVDSKSSTSGTLSLIGNVNPSTVTLQVGGQYNGSNDYHGEIDDARIYSRALSPSEVSALYNWAPGPVGYWKMDEGSGTTLNNTSSVYTDAATIDSTWGWTHGKYGNSAQLLHSTSSTAIRGYVSNPNNYISSTANSFTISGFFRVDDASGLSYWWSQEIIGRTATTNNGACSTMHGLILEATDATTVRASVNIPYQNAGSSCNQATTAGYGTSISLNEWHHTGITFNGSTKLIEYYLDGKLIESVTWGGSGDWTWTDDYIFFGMSEGSPTDAIGVSLDEVKIYNYARTSQQIIEDMNAGHPAPGSPIGSAVAFWKFDEMYGTTANDSIGGNSNLTLSANTRWTTNGKYAAAFNGADNQRLTGTDDSDLEPAASEDFAISAWVKSDGATTAASEYLVSKGGSGAGGYQIYFNTSGQIVCAIDDDATSWPEDSATTTTDYYDTNWHHLVCVRDITADKLYLYVDGKLDAQDTDLSATGSLATTSTFYLNDTNATDGTDEFLGDLDEVKFYRSLLTSDQVKVEYNKASSQLLGATSTDSSGNPTYSKTNEFCPPRSSGSCTPPIAIFPLDENSGTTNVYDRSGSGYTGTLNGSMLASDWINGKFGSGLNLDGTDDDIDTGIASTTVTNSLTFSVWFYSHDAGNIPDTPSTMSQVLVSQRRTSSNPRLDLGLDNNRLAANWWDTDNNQIEGTTVLSANTWYHATLVYDGTDVIIYLNAVRENSGSESSMASASSDNIVLGDANNSGNSQPFDGFLDEARIYDYARTQAQIAWEYSRGAPVGHWKLDECSGTTAYDASGHSNNGTITIGATGSNTSAGSCSSGNSAEAWNNGTSGKRNYSLDFDGTDDYIEVTSPSGLDVRTITISAWVKSNVAGTTYSSAGTVVNRNMTNNGTYQLFLNDSTDDMTFGIRLEGSEATSRNVAADNNLDTSWHHYAGTYDGSNQYLYVDGVLQSTSNSIAGTIDLDGPGALAVGRIPSDSGYFDGQIDEVKIFNYVLTQKQMQTLYNDGVVNFGN